MKLIKIWLLFIFLFQVSCISYYEIPPQYEYIRLTKLKEKTDTIQDRIWARDYFKALTTNYKKELCSKYKNNFFKDKNIGKRFNGMIIVKDDWANNGGIKSCRIIYNYKDSIYYYSDGVLSSVESVNYLPEIYYNSLEYRTDADTLTKDKTSLQFTYSDVMIIKNGKVQKYFNFITDEYYYLGKGQKKFKPVIIDNEDLNDKYYGKRQDYPIEESHE